MNEKETFRIATAELIGFGTAGSLIDAAYEVLTEVDRELATQLDLISSQIFMRFEAAEALLFSIGAKE